jgi:hypothetical protein
MQDPSSLLASIDAEIQQIEHALSQATTEPERARARAEARALLARVDGHIETVDARNAEIDARKAEMVRQYPVLRTRATRRQALRGKTPVLRPARQARSRGRRERRHVARSTSSSDPGDSDPPPPAVDLWRWASSASWDAFVASIQSHDVERQIKRERDGGQA